MAINVNRASAATVSFITPQEIVINHADDSIKVGDGSRLASVTTENALKVDASHSVQPISQASYSTRVDEASDTVIYVGKAEAGTGAGAAYWQISRMTISGTVTVIEFADGDTNFDNVWNNRASLTYF